MARTVLGILSVSLLALLSVAATPPPNLQKTLAAQRELAASQPYDASVHNDLGNLLVLDGRYDEAEEAYRSAIAVAPESAQPRFNLGVLLQQLDRRKEALAELRGVLEIDDRHARTYYQLGMLYEARKQRAAALEHYARAFALDPELTFARVNPHIIDNRLATEAILMSQRFVGSPSADMPRLYGEPERIAGLMLGRDEDAAAAEPAAVQPAAGAGSQPTIESVGQSAEGQAAGQQAGDRGREDDDDDDSSEEQVDAGRRVLTHHDLEADSGVGQVKGTAATRRRPAVGITTQPGTDATGRDATAQPAPRQPTVTGRTPASRPRYRPAARLSTGRLELRLLPPEPAEPRATR